ncbi:MAG TPA: hypothetical protein VG713_18760, partial [Pirellulales bacterium]|nr:hypothetical protein [Pirellulales bacterium]
MVATGMRLLVCLMLFGAWRAVSAAPILDTTPAAASEGEYYRLVKIPIPEGIVLEAGAMDWMPDGRLAVSTRRGEIYLVENVLHEPASGVQFKRFASGMHEVLGLAYRDGSLYAAQRGELTRLTDTDGDGRADTFETVADGWDISGDYHEYTFGSHFDPHGDLWLTLCLTGSFSSPVKYRGWCLRYTKDGKLVPTAH